MPSQLFYANLKRLLSSWWIRNSLYSLISSAFDSRLLRLISAVPQHRQGCKDECSSWCCAVLWSSQSSQFQTIGGISHHRHHQHRARGRHLKAARPVLSSPSGLASFDILSPWELMLSSKSCRGPECDARMCHIWKISLRIYAARDGKQQNEQIIGETGAAAAGFAFRKSSFLSGWDRLGLKCLLQHELVKSFKEGPMRMRFSTNAKN